MNWPSCPKPNETGRFLASLSGACHRRPLNRKSQFATGNVQHATRQCAERRDRIDRTMLSWALISQKARLPQSALLGKQRRLTNGAAWQSVRRLANGDGSQ